MSFSKTKIIRSGPVKRMSVSKVIIYFVLVMWAFGTLFPFLWVFNSSFKTTEDILSNGFSLPKVFSWDNYLNAFEKQNLLRSYGSSLLISGSVTIFVMIFALLASFGLTRYNFKGKNILIALVIGSLMFPVFSTIIPVFRMIAKMKLISHPLGVILPQVAGNLSFAIIVLTGYLRDIPLDMEEAAFIDGCGVFRILTKVIVPITTPALATVAIFTFLWSYNDLFTQLIIMRDRQMYPISTLLNEISSKYGTDYGLMAAAVMLIVIPVVIVYILLQKNIVKGLTAGATKG